MNAHLILQQMRPSSFSEEERHSYQAEKMMMRQFMLMKQQDQVPAYLTVQDMKTWLLAGRSFLEEFEEIIDMTEVGKLLRAELAWTTARCLCLSHMEQELLEELDKEERLSQQFSRKVTVEGFQMLVSIIRPGAEGVVKALLQPLFSKLLKTFACVQISSGPLSAGNSKPAELSELEHSAALLVPEIVETALKFLLEEPKMENKTEATSAEIGRLLARSAAPCLAGFGSFPKPLLLVVCTLAARCMVKAVFKIISDRSRSFQMMDYDDSSFATREGVICAIKEMEIAASSQALRQLRTPEGPEEDTSSVKVEVGADVRLNNDDDLDQLQQGESVKEEFVPFFSFIWKMMTSCFCGFTEE